jgi:5-amino-6-(5-phosphoribosylamino)uracil reductase
MPLTRPHSTVILAMSADGKIADQARSPARFGSAADKLHLETQIAQADAVLFGAGTLRAYGTTLSITDPALLAQRRQQGKPDQPIHLVYSPSGKLDPQMRFFQQPVPRWLVTRADGQWGTAPGFDRQIEMTEDWATLWRELVAVGVERLAVTGGGQLVAALLAVGAIDELWLTVCPLILGGVTAPSPVGGLGFLGDRAPQLDLLTVEPLPTSEVLLHYRVISSPNF